MAVCEGCGQPVALLPERTTGRRVAFERVMVPRADDEHGAGYVPIREAGGVVMVPVTDLPDSRLAGVRWVAWRHYCRDYLDWHAPPSHDDPMTLPEIIASAA